MNVSYELSLECTFEPKGKICMVKFSETTEYKNFRFDTGSQKANIDDAQKVLHSPPKKKHKVSNTAFHPYQCLQRGGPKTVLIHNIYSHVVKSLHSKSKLTVIDQMSFIC